MRTGHALAGADMLPALPRPLVQSGEKVTCFTLKLVGQHRQFLVSVCGRIRN
jgi:hypothetical protein